MHRQRSAINSFPEIIDLDQISVSNNSGMSQQAPINNMPSPVDSRSPTDIASSEQVLCVNALNHEVQSFSGWNSGESSSGLSSRNHIDVAETKMEERWPSSVNAHTVLGSRSEERRYEPNNILPGRVNIDVSGNHVRSGALSVRGSSSGYVPPTLNPDGNGGHNMRAGLGTSNFNSDGLEIERACPLSVSSNDASTSSGSSGSRLEENNVDAGSSVGGWGLSCKRKALEGTSGNSHPGGSTSCFPQTENAGRLASCHNASSSFSLSSVSQNSPSGGPPEQPNPRISFGMRGVAFNALPSATPSGNTHPGRGNHGHHPEPVRFNMSATEHARHSNLWSSHQSPRQLSFSDSLDMRSTAATAASSNTVQSQLRTMHTSNSTRNMHPFLWYEPSSLIAGNGSNFLNPGERAAVLQEEMNLRSFQRSSAERPMVAAVTDMRNLSQESTAWNLSSGNMSSSGSVPSTRNGPSPSSRPSPTPGRFHHQNPTTHNQQRFSEFAPWSLFPSVDSESGGHSGHIPALSSGPSASAQETATSSGSSIQGRIQPLQRSAFVVEGQPDDLLGMPRSLRALAADIEGRHRLISEIRQVLNAMRRGENLRVEDYMLFDPFIYQGMAEMHDRHRDMRLDVDNMSYEELLALEERIGDVSTGLGEETIMRSMKHQKFVSMVTGSSRDLEPCCICQEEFADGDDLGVLDCGHDFHTDCIKQWLMHKNLCPICKMTALLQS